MRDQQQQQLQQQRKSTNKNYYTNNNSKGPKQQAKRSGLMCGFPISISRPLIEAARLTGRKTAVSWTGGMHQLRDGCYLPWKEKTSYRAGYAWHSDATAAEHCCCCCCSCCCGCSRCFCCSCSCCCFCSSCSCWLLMLLVLLLMPLLLLGAATDSTTKPVCALSAKVFADPR